MTTPHSGKDRPNTYEQHSAWLIAIGREHNTSSPQTLAAEFYKRHGLAPIMAALDVAELILTGEKS